MGVGTKKEILLTALSCVILTFPVMFVWYPDSNVSIVGVRHHSSGVLAPVMKLKLCHGGHKSNTYDCLTVCIEV